MCVSAPPIYRSGGGSCGLFRSPLELTFPITRMPFRTGEPLLLEGLILVTLLVLLQLNFSNNKLIITSPKRIRVIVNNIVNWVKYPAKYIFIRLNAIICE